MCVHVCVCVCVCTCVCVHVCVCVFLLHSYTKPKGQLPDYESPVVLHGGHQTVEDLCNQLHKSIMKDFKQ